jgi:catechol 2,3-dioxygenase-like lactoylglutathione lyase family enzyme
MVPMIHPTVLPSRMHLELVTLIVAEYDPAIAFFVDVLGFTLVEDTPATTNDGRAKRWVVVRPPNATTGLLLARADGSIQVEAIGDQTAGRVGFFLRVDDFETTYGRMRAAQVHFLTEPRDEPYGRVVVFRDIAGNKWDLLGQCRKGDDTRAAGSSAQEQRTDPAEVGRTPCGGLESIF